MNRQRLLACVVALVLSRSAVAAVPESIDLVTTEYAGSCASPLPVTPNESFFNVDMLPIPSVLVGQDPNDNPPVWSEISSPFDSTILHEGANQFDFSIYTVNGSDYCTISRHQATLYDTVGGKHGLFDVTRNGTGYKGSTSIDLTLAQIDPTLAQDLAFFRDQIGSYEGDLIDNASKSDQLAHELDRLSDLQSQVDAMLEKGFDAIDQSALDALLQQYVDVGPEVQNALDQLITDLKKDVQQYRDEIAQIVAAYQMQVSSVTDGIVTGQARGGGFDPGNPSNYGMSTDPSQAPDIPVPQIGGDPFDPSHDPYGAYGSSIVAQLNATISGGVVQDRATFQSIVIGWRTNQSVVQHALELRAGVSQAEWGAFLNAQNSVLAVVRSYMDGNDWFKDAPIPDQLKQLVDGLMVLRMAEQAKRVKEGLNEWYGPQPTPQQQLMIDTLLALGDTMSDLDAETAEDPKVPSMMAKVLDGAAVVIKEAAKLAVYISPVGPFISICEAATGHEMCWPTGRTLGRGERVLSGATALIGGAVWWKTLGRNFATAGKLVCTDVAELKGTYIALMDGAEGVTKIAPNTYRSAAGLIYGVDKELENRIVHVLLHKYPAAYKDVQSVFSVAAEEIIPLLDEVWQKKASYVIKNGNWNYIVDLGRAIGTAGETKVLISVSPGTANVVTAFPML